MPADNVVAEKTLDYLLSLIESDKTTPTLRIEAARLLVCYLTKQPIPARNVS